MLGLFSFASGRRQEIDRDLLVGDFPGYFWHFDNKGTDEKPDYTAKGKWKTRGGTAKTPVY